MHALSRLLTELLSKASFYILCLLYYLTLPGYLYLVHAFMEADNLLMRVFLGVAMFLLSLFYVLRVDLLWLSYWAHKKLFGRVSSPTCSKPGFFGYVFLYYVWLAAGGVFVFFVVNENIIYMVRYYFTFLYMTISFCFMDYIIPSYARYKRLLEQNSWTYLNGTAG